MSIFQQTATAGMSTEIPTENNHSGALVAIIDLGTHSETYKGQNGKPDRQADVRKLYLVFELDEHAEGLKRNHVIGKEVTVTTSPKSTLRLIMEGLRGKAYAEGEPIIIDKAIGRPCLVNVKHKVSSGKGTKYAKLESISPIPKGMPPFKPTCELTVWEIGCGKPFPTHAWLPDSFLNGEFAPLEKIMEYCHEMRRGTAPATAPPPGDLEDVPF